MFSVPSVSRHEQGVVEPRIVYSPRPTAIFSTPSRANHGLAYTQFAFGPGHLEGKLDPEVEG